jgi:preprotein translocase subunit SecB
MDATPALEGAARVASVVHLRDIRLIELDFELHPIQSTGTFDVRLGADARFHQDEDALIYTVAFDVSAHVSTDPEADALFSCHVGYLVDYEIVAIEDVSDEAYEMFGRVSAVFSTYPYVREVVQSMTGRAGLDPLVLDVIRSPLSLIPGQTAEAP